jgi:hypothetical protein
LHEVQPVTAGEEGRCKVSQFKPNREALKIIDQMKCVSAELMCLAATLDSELAPPDAIEKSRQGAIAETEKLRRQCIRLLRKLKAARIVTEGGAA